MISPSNKEDRNVVRVFIKFLRLFYIVTLRFLNSMYVSSNKFFHKLMALIDRLNTLGLSGDILLKSIVIQMKKKLDKY